MDLHRLPDSQAGPAAGCSLRTSRNPAVRWMPVCLLLLIAAAAPAEPAAYFAAPDADWGPFYSRDTAVSGELRQRSLGPFIEAAAGEPMLGFGALRPLWSRTTDAQRPRRLTEVLWPLATYRYLDGEAVWRFATLTGHDYAVGEKSRYRVMAFPLLLFGRSAEGTPYGGLFPLYGDVREMLFKDRIRFFLFPLMLETWIRDIHSTGYLWPFISRAEGDRVSALRFFPLYGTSTRDNGRVRHRFFLWPFWTSHRAETSDSVSGGWILFPFYGRSTEPRGATTWVLPPFFRHTRHGENSTLYCPWPFLRFSSGDVERRYIWPLVGSRRSGMHQRSFLLWPIVRTGQDADGDLTRRWRMILPLYYHEALTAAGDEATDTYTKVWPLFSYQRVGDSTRFRALELWPEKHSGPVERNYSPFWTLLQSARDGENRDFEILWGLFRRRADGQGGRYTSLFPLFEKEHSGDGTRRWSLLKGLAEIETQQGPDGLKKHLKLLYFVKWQRESAGTTQGE